MQKYRVMIHGENLLTEVEGVRQKLGFFTNVFVEAFTVADAEGRAVEVVREDYLDLGTADFRPTLTSIRAANPDAILIVMTERGKLDRPRSKQTVRR